MPITTKIKNHTAATRALLTRVLEAASRIEYPKDNERAFRVRVMKRLQLVTDLRELAEDAAQERASDVRQLEAVCKIDRPNEEERSFRLMLMGKLAAAFSLAAMDKLTLTAK